MVLNVTSPLNMSELHEVVDLGTIIIDDGHIKANGDRRHRCNDEFLNLMLLMLRCDGYC